MQVRYSLASSLLPAITLAVGFVSVGAVASVHAALSAPVSSHPALESGKANSIPAMAPSATHGKESIQTEIGMLEEKLYEHKYAGESDEARISRIEKFVYGAPQTGTTAARVNRLQSSLLAESTAIDKVGANKSGNSEQNASTPSSSTTAKQPAAPTAAVKSSPVFDSANYPRVTQLEKDMLNATYDHEPLSQRLSRLEAKAFGKASTSDDLCERVDNLDEYAETHQIFKNRRSPLASTPVASTGNHGVFSNSFLSGRNFGAPASDDADEEPSDSFEEKKKAPVNPFVNGVSGTDQRLSAIEEFVYGHNYALRSAQDRLERLEKRLVPYQHNLAQKDVTYRVNNLWNILNVANTLNSAPTAAHPANTQAVATAPIAQSANTAAASSSTLRAPSQSTLTQATTAHHSWLHQLGKSLGSADISSNASNVPGIYPPDMGPKPGHLWVP